LHRGRARGDRPGTQTVSDPPLGSHAGDGSYPIRFKLTWANLFCCMRKKNRLVDWGKSAVMQHGPNLEAEERFNPFEGRRQIGSTLFKSSSTAWGRAEVK
jgi:hypothetical protein